MAEIEETVRKDPMDEIVSMLQKCSEDELTAVKNVLTGILIVNTVEGEKKAG